MPTNKQSKDSVNKKQDNKAVAIPLYVTSSISVDCLRFLSAFGRTNLSVKDVAVVDSILMQLAAGNTRTESVRELLTRHGVPLVTSLRLGSSDAESCPLPICLTTIAEVQSDYKSNSRKADFDAYRT